MTKVLLQEGDHPDAKKACWVPDEKEGYVLREIKATKGDLVTANMPGNEVSMKQQNWPSECPV